jgi:hypothetical protein
MPSTHDRPDDSSHSISEVESDEGAIAAFVYLIERYEERLRRERERTREESPEGRGDA